MELWFYLNILVLSKIQKLLSSSARANRHILFYFFVQFKLSQFSFKTHDRWNYSACQFEGKSKIFSRVITTAKRALACFRAAVARMKTKVKMSWEKFWVGLLPTSSQSQLINRSPKWVAGAWSSRGQAHLPIFKIALKGVRIQSKFHFNEKNWNSTLFMFWIYF